MGTSTTPDDNSTPTTPPKGYDVTFLDTEGPTTVVLAVPPAPASPHGALALALLGTMMAFVFGVLFGILVAPDSHRDHHPGYGHEMPLEPAGHSEPPAHDKDGAHDKDAKAGKKADDHGKAAEGDKEAGTHDAPAAPHGGDDPAAPEHGATSGGAHGDAGADAGAHGAEPAGEHSTPTSAPAGEHGATADGAHSAPADGGHGG